MAIAITRTLAWLSIPVAGGSVAWARRMYFGLAAFSSLRFLAKGWVTEFYVEPSYHFTWPGLRFVSPLSQETMVAVFMLMTVSALLAISDRFARPCATLFTALFAYVELIDRSYYLNHYYLITLVSGLFALTASALQHRHGRSWVPRWLPLLLRLQVGVVYFYAGVAKLNGDFLLRGEPLHTWMLHFGHLAYVGPLLTDPMTAIVMSWAGTFFDLLVVPALLWAKTRPYAYAAVVLFHIITGVLLDIGVFPAFMIALATVFFPYDWPQGLLNKLGKRHVDLQVPGLQPHRRLGPVAATLLATYVLLQVALPLRHVAYPGPVNWTEEGFRFAWRVMLFEKTGRVEYRIHDKQTGYVTRIAPHSELTAMQVRMLSTQPDMIRQYAHHLAASFRKARGHDVSVYADTAVSFNGRRASALMDPTCDLATPLFALSRDPCILQPPDDAP